MDKQPFHQTNGAATNNGCIDLKIFSSFFLVVWMSLVACLSSAEEVSKKRGISFGLNGVADWSTQHPFINIMKTARPWIGHLPNQWGGMEFETMLSDGVFDAEGWPLRIPDGVDRIESLILTDQPDDAEHLNGRYYVVFEGKGSLSVTGRARVVKREPGLRVFNYSPGPGAVGISIKATDADDPIRNIRVVREEHLERFQTGEIFNPLWIERLADVKSVRFMDWMFTNGSPIRQWGDLPAETDFSFVWRGVPLSVMIALANQIDADPWFNIPHMADDDLVRRFAETVKTGLARHRIAYVEYSNEVWNFLFQQAQWAGEQAEERWGESGDGWVQYYGFRAGSVMQIWTDVFGDEVRQRIKRVVAVHTGWPELEQSILVGENATNSLGFPPVELFDAYAVTGYFGSELGEPDIMSSVLETAISRAEAEGQAKGLSRVALREYVNEHRFEGAADQAAQKVRQGSLRELTQTLWPYHAEVADRFNLELIMYEGGTHATPIGAAVENELLVSFLMDFNYTQQMADLYEEALTSWSGLTGSPFNAFVDVASPSKWGSWGALRHLSDENPRWNALRKEHLRARDN